MKVKEKHKELVDNVCNLINCPDFVAAMLGIDRPLQNNLEPREPLNDNVRGGAKKVWAFDSDENKWIGLDLKVKQ